MCHKKTGFAYAPLNTAEAKVFLHWPFNSVVMRRNLKNTFFGTIFVSVLLLCFVLLVFFFLIMQVKHYNSVRINVQIQQNDCAIL